MNARQYRYTVADIAQIIGKSPRAIRYDVMQGHVDLEDLGSVAIYIVMAKLRQEQSV